MVDADEQPRASTSKEGAEPRVSVGTATIRDSLVLGAENLPVMDVTQLRRGITGPWPSSPSQDDASNILGYTSSLAKLQTYLPTGTWMAFTALQTWALSLRPDDPPVSPISNCNANQRIALIIVICLSTLLAFLSCFVKRFVYDPEHAHVLYPYPDLFNVAQSITDPVTGVPFPCRTKEKRYCWPLLNDAGEFKYDEKGRLRVMVFKFGIRICVRRKVWITRAWNSWFYPEEKVPDAPRLSTSTSPAPKHMSLSSNNPRLEIQDVTIDIDDILMTVPTLQPRWTHTIIGAFGSKAYLDMRPCVWAHASVSVLSFFTLALFSTQVCGCLYPSIPDYLPPTLQTGMLIILSVIAAVFIKDDAVSLGQTAPQHISIGGIGNEAEVPAHLIHVVDMLVWMRRDG